VTASTFHSRNALHLGAIAILLAGCGGTHGAPSLPFVSSQTRTGPAGPGASRKIEHVIFIVQEGRTVDNLFQGYPGADTVSSGKIADGKSVKLAPVSLKDAYVIENSAQAMFAECHAAGKLPGTDCRMDGFNKVALGCGQSGFPACPAKYPTYVYVPQVESKPYFDMAHEWVLADQTFQSQLDGIFTANEYTIAAQAKQSVDFPNASFHACQDRLETIGTLSQERTYGRQEPACFNFRTLGDELDGAKLTWRYYRQGSRDGGLGPYGFVRHIVDGPDWKRNVVAPSKRFIKDVAGGKLANFTWIAPQACTDSDWPGCGGGYGPSWVASLVNAVGESKFWDTTAIFVQWADWGSLYDHVAPGYVNYDGLGFRVPLLVISPYAKRDYVSHTHYETASVLRFAEDLFGLAQLSAADKRATSPTDCFDFSQKARAFVPIKAPRSPAFFLQQQ
jgi:phospholipase C